MSIPKSHRIPVTNMKKYLLLLAAAVFMAVSCDRVYVDEVVPHEPVITAFAPASAPVGAEVTVTGEHLNEVTAAYIGDTKVDIAARISNTRLVIKVVPGITSGVIKLVNATGSGTSAETFRCSFAVPEIAASLLQSEADMGESIMMMGTHLLSAQKVFFTSDGYTESHEAEIISHSDDEIVVKVPYVEDAASRITMAYFDGTEEVTTPLESAPAITVIRRIPRFDPFEFDAKTAVGRSITLTGEYLNNIDRVMVGDWEAPVYKSSDKLTFTIPAGDFQDGDTEVTLTAWYFEDRESVTLAESFIVFVPFVRFWQDVEMWCDGRVPENSFAAFFCPENGRLYSNESWKSSLDPVAFRLFGSQWNDKANQPKEGMISDEEYDSVLPYFFFSSVSGNVLQINGPANTNGQLKNFYINSTNPPGTNSAQNRVPGADEKIPGTPIICFRYLNPGNATENELIQKVLNDEIEKIDETTFPIDVAGSTIAGVSVTSLAGGIKSSNWCDHQTSSLVDDPGYKLDAVFIVAYYKNYGFNPDSKAAGIKRLGLLHVKQIDWGVFNSKFAASRVTVDCYWQKYDYDYSKL